MPSAQSVFTVQLVAHALPLAHKYGLQLLVVTAGQALLDPGQFACCVSVPALHEAERQDTVAAAKVSPGHAPVPVVQNSGTSHSVPVAAGRHTCEAP